MNAALRPHFTLRLKSRKMRRSVGIRHLSYEKQWIGGYILHKHSAAFPQISEAEFEVMQVIWEHGAVSTNQVVDILTAKTDWSPKTIQTMLIRLEKKGAITHEKNGRLYIYTPLVDREEYIARQSDAFLDKFFGGALDRMMVSYLSRNNISQEDLEELRAILDRQKKD